MAIYVIINVDENVIQIFNNKNVELFRKDLIHIFLEACWCVYQPKKHYLVLKVAVSSLEYGFSLNFFADSYSIVCTGKVELGEPLSFSQPI